MWLELSMKGMKRRTWLLMTPFPALLVEPSPFPNVYLLGAKSHSLGLLLQIGQTICFILVMAVRGTIIGGIICGWITNTTLAVQQLGSNSCELLTQEKLFLLLGQRLEYGGSYSPWYLRYGGLLREISAARNKWALTFGVLSTAKRGVKTEGEGIEIVTKQIFRCSQYCCSQRECRPSRGCEHRLCLRLWWRCWCSPLS